MDSDPLRDDVYEKSVTAGMNQRYHQAQATYWDRRDRVVKISTGVMAVVGAITAFSGPIWLAGTFSVVAAILAVAINLLPFAEWSARHADFFRRWTDLREEVDSLEYDANISKARLRRIDGLIHRICGSEPQPDRALLDKCLDEEHRSRGVNMPNETGEDLAKAADSL